MNGTVYLYEHYVTFLLNIIIEIASLSQISYPYRRNKMTVDFTYCRNIAYKI